MGKVKELNQSIREDMEVQSLLLGERGMFLSSAIQQLTILTKPEYKYNKNELYLLNKIIKTLKSMREVDWQTEDLIDQELRGDEATI
jgi:hypothetical protein